MASGVGLIVVSRCLGGISSNARSPGAVASYFVVGGHPCGDSGAHRLAEGAGILRQSRRWDHVGPVGLQIARFGCTQNAGEQLALGERPNHEPTLVLPAPMPSY